MQLRARAALLAVAATATLMAPLAAAYAQQGPTIPPPRGMVNDFANVIPAAQAARIERLATAVRAQSGGEIVVVTLPDLGGRDETEVALRIGREWKVGSNAAIGAAARNTGIIILVVPKETSRDGKGHVRIEVGQGTEGFLTDGQAGDIWREAIPRLQARDYGGASELMVGRVAQRYAANFGFSLDSLAGPSEPPVSRQRRVVRNQPSILPFAFIAFLIVLFLLGGGRGRGSGCLWFALGEALGSSRGGGGGFGGGGGGGFGGFGGGGGFSGGGSGGSW